MEATFRGNPNTIVNPNCIGYFILGPEIWKPLLDEIMKLSFIQVVMVTAYTENTRSRNMEATF